MASKKQQQQQQQEMVQVDRSSSASPFWRSNSSAASRSHDTKKVVGASYSHADILRLDSLALSSSRPRTPPSTTYGRVNTPPRFGSSLSPPPPNNYTSLYRSTSHESYGEDDEEEEEEELAFDDDEDEFGLPSIASMRRKSKRKSLPKGKDPGGTFGAYSNGRSIPTSLSTTPVPTTTLQTGDIADDRPIPSYPSTHGKTEGKILRPQYKEILRDPANSLHLISHPPISPSATPKETEAHSARLTRINKFKRLLQQSTISLPELRSLAWSGIPEEVRAMSWQLLLGYLPTSSERRVATLERKRKEYLEGVRQAFERGTAGSDGPVNAGLAGGASGSTRGRGRGLDEAIWHQISIDVPRTNPHLRLYAYEATQRSLERILYVWAIRHPASGYVQGINDLVTPFWQVFLGMYITDYDVESGMDPGQLPRPVLDAVEADSFWCLTKLLDGIQDNYICGQPGILRQVAGLRDLVGRIDEKLAKHLEREGVEFIQFSFRWINCLLMREISVKNTTRMWDTYLAEEHAFSSFHLYVCAAFLVKWSDQLLKMDFGEIMLFLQHLPSKEWTEKDIELLLSEAFIWQSLFRGSSAHLKGQGQARAGGGFEVGMGP
ncbi:GTPase-activating protein [Coniosporium apollinis]|uniref:GTPase-activating protein n=1 Tax=Coniosporium apollinis TaxID=61459 RepID=A0ABQ9NZN2_9PEZI|nr:GTPase-activating protein [Coniosporium apollinis]